MVIGQKEHGLTYGQASLIFGLAEGIMQAVLALCVPILGAFGDNAGKRKPFVISLGGICLLFASFIGFFHNITVVLIFYILSNVAYQCSLIFYDSKLN